MNTHPNHPPTLHLVSSTLQPAGEVASSSAMRHQIAVVRTLLDELERALARKTETRAVVDQLISELSRLGCKGIDAAAALAREVEAEDHPSGVFRVKQLMGI